MVSDVPIRIFCGCSPNNADLESQAVVEWSLRKNTKRELDITWMILTRDPANPWYSNGKSGWQVQQGYTPFSSFRWSVPGVCNYEGQAIYTDSDVIFVADIGELWDQKFQPGKIVMGCGGEHSWRLCVSKWDCAAAKKYLPSLTEMRRDPFSHHNLIRMIESKAKEILQPFAGSWNTLDCEGFRTLDPAKEPRLKAIHMTTVATQCQLKYALPRLQREGGKHWYNGPVRPHPRKDLIELFDRLYKEAEQNGYGIERYRRTEHFGDHRKVA